MQKFSILSTGAPLVEVNGSGPFSIRAGGLRIADGALKTASVELLSRPVRQFRVDAPASVRTLVSVTESPYGVFVGVRRCVPVALTQAGRVFAVARWPRLRAVMRRVSPSLVALWHLLSDESPARCTWR